MSLVLALETSSADYGVVLGGPGSLAQTTRRHDSASFAGVGDLVVSLLREVGADFTDIRTIAVDVGPGYGSVRAGVSYANGLSFSLQRPLFVADSLRLLALEVGETGAEATLCVRNAGSGIVCAGLFCDGVAVSRRSGPLRTVIPALVSTLSEVALAGALREEVAAMMRNVKVHDTGLTAPHASTLYDLVTKAGSADPGFVVVASPLNESSSVFVE